MPFTSGDSDSARIRHRASFTHGIFSTGRGKTMAWQTNRAARLPSDWRTRRLEVKARANGQCQWITEGVRCKDQGTECDHIVNNDDHSLSNLQWLCAPHHHQKTLQEAATARALRSRYRPKQQHPGLK